MSVGERTTLAAEVLESAELLFEANSSIFEELRGAVQEYERDLEELRTPERDSNLWTVAFIGKRNRGKTTLLKALFPEDAKVQALTSGEGVKTEEVVGVGSRRPSNSLTAADPFIKAAPPLDIPEGHECCFFDTPPYGLADAAVNARLRRVYLGSDLKILIVGSDDLQIEDLITEVLDADGSVILPVIRLMSARLRNKGEAMQGLRDEVDAAIRQWRACLTESTILEPVYLDCLDSRQSEETLESIRLKLVEALLPLLQSTESKQRSAAGRNQAAEARLKHRMRAILDPRLARLQRAHREMRMEVRNLPETAVDYLCADEVRLQVFIKWEIRRRLLMDLRSFSFPVRSVWTVIAYTSGAWERLLLGLHGSMLSAVMTGHQSVKNVAESVVGEKHYKTELNTGLKGHLRNRINPSFQEFSKEIMHLGGRVDTAELEALEIELEGIDSLTARWSEAVAENVKPRGTRLSRFFEYFASGSFWYIIGGPVVYLYLHHLPAVWSVFAGSGQSIAANPFPVFSGSQWITTLLLALVPSALIGIIVFANRCRADRVARITKELNRSMRAAVTDNSTPFAVKVRSKKVRALEKLLSWMHDAGRTQAD